MPTADGWYPTGTHSHYGPPPVGALTPRDHAVWRVTHITDLPLADHDRDTWIEAGMPDPATWKGRPYKVGVEYVGGARPDWAPTDGDVPATSMSARAQRFGGVNWKLYPPSGRWPMCSCCGEPMPCRAELQDREVDQGLERVETWASRRPGCCWGCGEPITGRQKAVAYPGDNLDLPGGPEVRFHSRASCWDAARRYELRWIDVDPRRERILTYPKCAGILIVHADRSSECRAGRGPLGDVQVSQPDCRGHLTHDHGTQAACYVGEGWLSRPSEMPGCPRGCSRTGHPGAAPSARPPRNQGSLL